jgi:cytoskeletal protein CcmA (bactofilin family)
MFARKSNRSGAAQTDSQSAPHQQGTRATPTQAPLPPRGEMMNETVPYQPNVAPARNLTDIPRSRRDDYPGAASAPGQSRENRMTVGREIKLKGEISNCDVLVVEGDVEATLDGKMLEVAAGGTFNGTATVESAEIHGVFDGTLTIAGLLRVHGTGRVSGKLRYGKIEVQSGGELSGDIASAASASAASPIRAAESS